MGSFLSSLFGGAEDENGLTLFDLLDPDDNGMVDWNAICLRLEAFPEEAAAYCHSVDPSPLMRALLLAAQSSSLPPPTVIQAFLEAYPEAAFHTDRRGVTPLQAAVQGLAEQRLEMPPRDDQADDDDSTADDDDAVDDETNNLRRNNNDELEGVRLLVQANPAACRQVDQKGRLPLHFVRTNRAVAELLLLLSHSNDSRTAVTQTDATGKLPLHYCVNQHLARRPTTNTANANAANGEREQQQQQQDGAATTRTPSTTKLVLPDPAVVQLLVDRSTSLAHGGVLVKDRNGTSPLDLVYRELQAVLAERKEQVASSKQQQQAPTTATALNNNKRLDGLWEILTILVRATTTNNTTKKDNEAEQQPPFRMVFCLLGLRCPAAILQEALTRFPDQAAMRDEHGRTPLLLAACTLDQQCPPASSILQVLVAAHADAARMTDREGRLPIDVLAENAESCYTEQLFEAVVQAEPRAVDTRDLQYGQHPFVTAALSPNSNVAAVYHLLRAKPHVISYYHTN